MSHEESLLAPSDSTLSERGRLRSARVLVAHSELRSTFGRSLA
jgi:hypothetical protein